MGDYDKLFRARDSIDQAARSLLVVWDEMSGRAPELAAGFSALRAAVGAYDGLVGEAEAEPATDDIHEIARRFYLDLKDRGVENANMRWYRTATRSDPQCEGSHG